MTRWLPLMFMPLLVLWALDATRDRAIPFAVDAMPEGALDSARKLQASLRGLPPIDANTATDAAKLRQQINVVITDINRLFGTDFERLVDIDEADLAIAYLPVVEEYNLMLQSAEAFDGSDKEGAKKLYQATFSVVSTAITIKGKVAQKVVHKASYETVGLVNNAAKLGVLRGICGDGCYSFVLSKLYWSVRACITGVFTDFEDWFKKQNISLQHPNITCS